MFKKRAISLGPTDEPLVIDQNADLLAGRGTSWIAAFERDLAQDLFGFPLAY
ncbi:hypothetical protein N234_06725 [Ralstonia pickettii DTP0602]|nr:hypothetical protein N234_06725 [Ralstonia pickettii DTP0602]